MNGTCIYFTCLHILFGWDLIHSFCIVYRKWGVFHYFQWMGSIRKHASMILVFPSTVLILNEHSKEILIYWLFGNIASIVTKLPVYGSIYHRATLPKTIRSGTKTANKKWRHSAIIIRHIIIEIVSSFLLLSPV